MTGLELLILFALAWGLMFIKPSSIVWTLVMGTVLLLATIYCGFSLGLNILLWVIFTPIAIFANVAPLRIITFSLPFLYRFRKILPPMSSTERDALEAGDVWWEGDLFAGRPNWNKLQAIPKPTLTQEERDFLNNQTETLCSMLDDWKIMQEDCDLTEQTWDYLKKQGFFGLAIAKKYGGKGFSAIAHSTIVSKISTRSISAAVDAMVPNSLGPGELLAHYGTEEQKDYYLPRLAKGEEIPCFALTSLDAGSDAGAMHDYGIVCKGQYEGKAIIGIKLTWNKRYITLAPIATVLGLAFKLYDPEHLLGDKENIGITVCLLPTSHPGVNVGARHYPLNLAFMNGPTEGKDVFIPLDWIIGGQEMAGKGWRMLMECLSIGRSISLPALSAGIARLCYYTTGMYAHLRKQFNLPIGEFTGVQEAMARIAGNTYLLEASRQMTAGAVDLNVKPSVVSAIQKYHSTELARDLYNAALDIHAGHAIQLGPRNYLGQIHMGIPMMITVEGANILTRSLIIFGQGAIRCHPYVLKEIAAANDSNKKRSVKMFDRILKSHIGYTVSNMVRALSYGLTNARFVVAPKHKDLSHYYRQLSRMSNALALTSDFAMLSLGGQLKRRERLSARLGDVLSYLYLGSCVLKYHADEGYPEEDIPYVKWCLETALIKIQQAFKDFLQNFPARGLAKISKFLIFPLGYHYSAPTDNLESQIVEMMMQPGSLRDRLSSNVYSSEDPKDCIGRLAAAFDKANSVKHIDIKIKNAIVGKRIERKSNFEEQAQLAEHAGIISQEDAEIYVQAQHMIREAMEVDAFEHDYLANRQCKNS